jgi:secreted trypsin-like serine protease
LPTTLADWITISFCGTSDIGPREVVGAASIFYTTSMPCVTLPNTA